MVQVSKLGDRACLAFNRGACQAQVSHPSNLHVCSYCLPVPSNLNLHHWEEICVTPDNHLILQYLQFTFTAGYEGPVPTPTFHNHPSAVCHSNDVHGGIHHEGALGGSHARPFQSTPVHSLDTNKSSPH